MVFMKQRKKRNTQQHIKNSLTIKDASQLLFLILEEKERNMKKKTQDNFSCFLSNSLSYILFL